MQDKSEGRIELGGMFEPFFQTLGDVDSVSLITSEGISTVALLRSISLPLCQRLCRVEMTLTSEAGCDFRQLPISTNCVFDASLVPETCLDFPTLPV
jgi:hypothetical protein